MKQIMWNSTSVTTFLYITLINTIHRSVKTELDTRDGYKRSRSIYQMQKQQQQQQHRLFVNHRAPICPVPPIFVCLGRAQGPPRSSPGPLSRVFVDGATGECSTSTKIVDIGTDRVRSLCDDSSSPPLVVAPISLFYPL